MEKSLNILLFDFNNVLSSHFIVIVNRTTSTSWLANLWQLQVGKHNNSRAYLMAAALKINAEGYAYAVSS